MPQAFYPFCTLKKAHDVKMCAKPSLCLSALSLNKRKAKKKFCRRGAEEGFGLSGTWGNAWLGDWIYYILDV